MLKKATPALPPIVQSGDPVLRAHAASVAPEEFGTRELAEILARMEIALEGEDDGVAIAAPQIGVSKRIFVVSRRAFMLDEHGEELPLSANQRKALTNMIFINPEITKLSKRKHWLPEGCLSVRWLYGKTHRSDKAAVRAQDATGKVFTYGGSGLLAQIFQHETDHLNGILFIDHAKNIEELPPEKVEELRREREKAEQMKDAA